MNNPYPLTMESFGLTREAIMRHVVSIAPATPEKDLDAIRLYRERQKRRRAANIAAGLTAEGKPRQRKQRQEWRGLSRKARVRLATIAYRKKQKAQR